MKFDCSKIGKMHFCHFLFSFRSIPMKGLKLGKINTKKHLLEGI